MKAIFINFCPNCKENISDERLSKGSLCAKCLSFPYSLFETDKIIKELKIKNRLKDYKALYCLFKEYQEVTHFYKTALNSLPTNLQETWIKRVLLGKSFAIIAPTGIGKTAFGLLLSLYFASKNKKVYLIFPTSLLVQQAEQKLIQFANRIGKRVSFLAYHSSLKPKEKKEVLAKIEKGDFSILITTDRFLSVNGQKIKDKFDFVFVDDVDSFLKTSKNIDLIVRLLGGSDRVLDIIEKKLKNEPLSQQEKKLLEESKKKLGILVFSSATARQRRTKKIRIFKELFGFDVGFRPEFVRNVSDLYLETKDLQEKAVEYIRKLGKGGLVFVPTALGADFGKSLTKYFKEKGIKCEYYEKPDPKLIQDFKKGRLEVLVGIASYKSPLARGLDLPEVIRYAIFVGVPRQEISLSLETFNPNRLLTLANTILPILEDKSERIKLEKVINKLRKIVPLSKEQITAIEENYRDNSSALSNFLQYALQVILEAKSVLSSIITPQLLKLIEQREDLRLKKDSEGFKLIVADAIGYLQASGRTSRMFIGGISKGLSLILVDDQKAFFGLKKKLEYYLEEFEIKEANQKAISEVLKEVDKDRQLILLAQQGKLSIETQGFIQTTLIIVESPTKAKTIARFFGKPARREINGLNIFEISSGSRILNLVASIGHILDLVENKGFDGVEIIQNNKELKFIPLYDSIKKCRQCGAQFVEFQRCPKCQSKDLLDKRNIIATLQKIALEVNQILIATDPDAEGEKIAFDLYNLLKPFNSNIKRIEFHEITKRAIFSALDNPREVNQNLVEAQIVRRIEDRWIGFELSKILQRQFKQPNLSAGRVQTPVLGWIIERTSLAYQKINLAQAKIIIDNLPYYFSFREVPEEIVKAKEITIKTETKEDTVYPLPPYTTDTLLKDASRLFKFSTAKTMQVLQNLFEVGLITYHRTDSTHVSNFGINLAKKWLQEQKKEYLFKPRSYGKEGAHECIRPTRAIDSKELVQLLFAGILRFPIKLSRDHLKLYDLIFKRFIASQCKEAKVIRQIIRAQLQNFESVKENIVEIKDKGFYEITSIKTHPQLSSGRYPIEEIKLMKVPKEKPFRQGDVIALMKEKGIGRPSTYSKIMQTLLEREYVKEVKNYLFSTKKGFVVYKFLNSKYSQYVSEEFTRKLEKDMDLIERGEEDYEKVLKDLYFEVRELIKGYKKRIINLNL